MNIRQINKFNIHWQIVRVNARSIKNASNKIKYVMNFLKDNKNIHNYGRVLNWLQMSKLGYKNLDRKFFDYAISLIKDREKEYDYKDNDNDFSKVSREDLLKVYNDLSKRKYGFLYKNTPKSHTEFMIKLKNNLFIG